MPLFLTILSLQAAALPPDTWKERNLPDMPVLPPCDLGPTSPPVTRKDRLPAGVVTELDRYFRAGGGLSEGAGPFNKTDVVSGDVPLRRFTRAYHVSGYWIIWYEWGGLVYRTRTIALALDRTDNDPKISYRVQPGRNFTGNLCAATKAIVAGVESGVP